MNIVEILYDKLSEAVTLKNQVIAIASELNITIDLTTLNLTTKVDNDILKGIKK